MPEIKIVVTDAQLKAVNAVVMDATKWVQAAFDGKASSCRDRVLTAQSNKNVNKLSEEDKETEFESLDIKSRKSNELK